jgi:hypothetical protein
MLFEAGIGRGFAVEVNGLYRALQGTDRRFEERSRFAHVTWEFPLLLKYRIPGPRRGTSGWRWGGIQPFIEAGPSLRLEGNLNIRGVSPLGATAGAGIEKRIGGSRMKIAPMIRYTRWGQRVESDPRPYLARAKRDQAQLLVALSF